MGYTLDDRLAQVFQHIDKANSQDPNRESWQGTTYPKEVLYAIRMTDILSTFEPTASVALQIAARGQHICRWQIPRSDFPMNRAGYLKWRSQLKIFHADKVSGIMRELSWEEPTIERVAFLILKKRLKQDPETQTLEDVICLVFLQYYFDEFSHKYDERKMVGILQKTWAKMSPEGHQAALSLTYSPQCHALIATALGSEH